MERAQDMDGRADPHTIPLKRERKSRNNGAFERRAAPRSGYAKTRRFLTLPLLAVPSQPIGRGAGHPRAVFGACLLHVCDRHPPATWALRSYLGSCDDHAGVEYEVVGVDAAIAEQEDGGVSHVGHCDEPLGGRTPDGRVVRYVSPTGAVADHAWVQRVHAVWGDLDGERLCQR